MTPTAQIAQHEPESLTDAELLAYAERIAARIAVKVAEPGAIDRFVRQIDTLLKNAGQKTADTR